MMKKLASALLIFSTIISLNGTAFSATKTNVSVATKNLTQAQVESLVAGLGSKISETKTSEVLKQIESSDSSVSEFMKVVPIVISKADKLNFGAFQSIINIFNKITVVKTGSFSRNDSQMDIVVDQKDIDAAINNITALAQKIEKDMESKIDADPQKVNALFSGVNLNIIANSSVSTGNVKVLIPASAINNMIKNMMKANFCITWNNFSVKFSPFSVTYDKFINAKNLVINLSCLNQADSKTFIDLIHKGDPKLNLMGNLFKFNMEAGYGSTSTEMLNFSNSVTISVKNQIENTTNGSNITCMTFGDDKSKDTVNGQWNDNVFNFNTDKSGTFGFFSYSSNKFNDLKAGSEIQKDAEILAIRGITNGIGNGKFSPDSKLTRAEFATFVARSLKLSSDYYGFFKDVKKTDWFGNPVDVLKRKGIVNGTNATNYSPNANITNEQVISILMRVYEQYTGKKSADIAKVYKNGILDINKVHAYSSDYVKAANVIKLIDNGSFAPEAYTKRADMAKFLVKLMKELNLL